MKWASASSTNVEIHTALDEVSASVEEQLDQQADLLVVFVSSEHRGSYAKVSPALCERFPAATIVGSSAGGVIGGGQEIEESAGLTLTAASLPDVHISAVQLEHTALPSKSLDPDAWASLLGAKADEPAAVIMLVDPFSCDAQQIIEGIDRNFEKATIIGGLVSGGLAPMTNALFSNDGVGHTGALVVCLSGDLGLDTIVAQGCRPIDRPRFVTGCTGSVIQELDGKPAMEVLRSTYNSSSAEDQDLFRHSLFVGVAMRDKTEQYELGDFLIRPIAGIDPATGAVVISSTLEEYAVVQLHVRDAKTSADELSRLLQQRADSGQDNAGALLFSCLGRGRNLYKVANHDSGLFARYLDAPLGGLFCNGEIGPVQGKTFLHGFTSAFGIFRTRS